MRLKDDFTYVKALFYTKHKEELDLINPKTFMDKLNWLKLYKFDTTYNKFVDKYEVREFVKQVIGEEYLNELLFVYDDVDAISIDNLPESFVLKYTHSSGHNLIVKDKSNFNWTIEKEKFSKFSKVNYYFKYREKVYDKIKPRIVAEKYLNELQDDDLIDYKFYCFHGEPKYIVVKTIEKGRHKICYYDLDWNKILPKNHMEGYLYTKIDKPSNFTEMLEISKKLSVNFILVRVDLYSIDNKIYFGELTFIPQGGRKKIIVESLNYEFGNLIKLPNS